MQLNIPLYQSGEVEAQVRQAKQQHQGRLQDIAVARDTSRAQAVAYFAQVKAGRAQVLAIKRQVAAASESLSGTREQQRAGHRTLLDVLNAEKELTDAQIAAVQTHRDLVVSSFTLLAVMGRLTAADLGLKVPLYDVSKHYADTDGRWAGTDAPETGASNAVSPDSGPGWVAATQVQN